MAKPIEHDAATSTVTTAWETGKGAAKWLLGPPVIGAVVGGLAGWALTAGAAAALSAPVVIGVVVGLLAGGAFSATFGSWMAGIGAVLGFAKGRTRVHQEEHAFERQNATRGHIADARMEKAHAIGAQQGYVQGVQDGQAMVVEKLRQMQYAAIHDEMAKAKEANCKPCSHAEKVLKSREVAAVGQQIG